MKINSAVVNGCLGTVGIALVQKLMERGVGKVYAVAYPGDPRIRRIPEGATVVPCDMREIETIRQKGVPEADAFFHLAWMGTIGPGRNDAMIQTENIRCSLLAVRAAQDLGCQVFVGVGSQAEHGRIEGKVTPEAPCFPNNGYGIAKLCAGQLTRLACGQIGLRHVWARILSAYGPGDGPLSVIPTMLDKLMKGEKPSLTKGEQKWDFCFSGDVAEALCCMAEKGKDGAIYPVGSGQVRTLREYFEITRDTVDPELPLGIGELPYNENQVMWLQADLTALREDTRFEPKVPFEEGIRITAEAYRKQLEEE